MERSYLMLKPGFCDLLNELKKRLKTIDVKIIETKEFTLTPEVLKEHYAHLLSLPNYPNIEQYMISGPVIGMIVEGPDGTIANIRKILGPTRDATKGTIRGDYAKDMTRNVLHASDSKESAAAEIKRFFGK